MCHHVTLSNPIIIRNVSHLIILFYLFRIGCVQAEMEFEP